MFSPVWLKYSKNRLLRGGFFNGFDFCYLEHTEQTVTGSAAGKPILAVLRS